MPWGCVLSQCRRSYVVEHGECHVAHDTLTTLDHLYVNAKCIRKLSALYWSVLLKAVDQYLERRDHSGTIGCDDLTLEEGVSKEGINALRSPWTRGTGI
jgi:hypothetical protein